MIQHRRAKQKGVRTTLHLSLKFITSSKGKPFFNKIFFGGEVFGLRAMKGRSIRKDFISNGMLPRVKKREDFFLS